MADTLDLSRSAWVYKLKELGCCIRRYDYLWFISLTVSRDGPIGSKYNRRLPFRYICLPVVDILDCIQNWVISYRDWVDVSSTNLLTCGGYP